MGQRCRSSTKNNASDQNNTMASLETTVDDSGSNSTSDRAAGADESSLRRPSTRYKGVVLQQNGKWGAQIYTRTGRTWLGTFNSELAAAAAYDSAAAKLKSSGNLGNGSGSHHHRNLPPTELTPYEHAFQQGLSQEAVLTMIRDGSYANQFDNYLWAKGVILRQPSYYSSNRDGSGDKTVRWELFQKELTPSDVGKLNRLVVPKKHAVQHFPPVPDPDEPSKSGKEVTLQFRDRDGDVWEFRYCYWTSSQSFVFTKGWNKFVKDKGLAPQDVIAFYRCEERHGESYHMIDVIHRHDDSVKGEAQETAGGGAAVVEAEEQEMTLTKMLLMDGGGKHGNNKCFKLFGVFIC